MVRLHLFGKKGDKAPFSYLTLLGQLTDDYVGVTKLLHGVDYVLFPHRQ